MNFRKNSHTWVSLWINKIRFQSWSNWYFSLKLHGWFQRVGRIKGHWNKGGKWHFSLSLCNCSHFCISNINPSINSLTHTSCIYLFILSFIQLVNYSSSTNSLSHFFFSFFLRYSLIQPVSHVVNTQMLAKCLSSVLLETEKWTWQGRSWPSKAAAGFGSVSYCVCWEILLFWLLERDYRKHRLMG